MKPEEEERIARVQANAKLSLTRRLEEREHSIITRMVVAYRSGRLESEQIVGMVGAISELRAIAEEAERDGHLAERAIENFTRS